MSGVKVKKVAGYIMLPGIIPRARRLFASGFGYIAFLVANIFSIVRLLPTHHPYLVAGNIGKFGIKHVIAEAANNLVFSRRNIDQIIIFVLILTGMVLMLLQVALALYGILFKPAMAQVGYSLFVTPKPQRDIAFMLLDEVFGIPGLYNSCVALKIACKDGAKAGLDFPWAFHDGLHSMFQFYSMGLLFIGLLIFIYFLIIIVVETAASGTPFGQRFQNIWVPIRLVVALGLLVPINYGMNSAQYIVLYAAKMGSSFATNGWLRYNELVADGASGKVVFRNGDDHNPIGERESLLAKPQTPSTAPFVEYMSIAQACAYSYWKTNTGDAGTAPPAGSDIKPYLVKNSSGGANDTDTFLLLENASYDQALKFYKNSDIIVVFGKRVEKDERYNKYPGNVMPLCGTLRLQIGYLKNAGQGTKVGGPDQIQKFWFDLIKQTWFKDNDLINLSHYFVENELDTAPQLECTDLYNKLKNKPTKIDLGNNKCELGPLSSAERQLSVNTYNAQIKTAVDTAWDTYNKQGKDIRITQEILDRGWAGAGIWYNIIADINGGFVSAVINMPLPVSYPLLMEQVKETRRKSDADVPLLEQFDPNTANEFIGSDLQDPSDAGQSYKIATILSRFYQYWNVDSADQAKNDATPIGNFILDVMNALFGTNGLVNLRTVNANIHPLAQLAAIGKGLVDSAIIYVGVGVVSAAGGGLIGALSGGQSGSLLTLASDISINLAFIGLTAGFILYYVLPFLPFLYFFFAVATWIKTIFEAMVGAPLWALAHLRLDGEGLSGSAATTGYLLILDLFLRPILTVIALVGSMLILTAQVRVLNLLWDLVIDNLTGFSGDPARPTIGTPRGVVDSYFFTVLYAIIVYMLATASFKLIDAIPDNILKFFGGGASSFSDINPDATEGLTRYAAVGGITFGQEVTGATKGLAQGLGASAGGELQKLGAGFSSKPTPPTGQ